jgi:hypothetical protein
MRISTLMLLVIIAALAAALEVEHTRRLEQAQLAEARMATALAEARQGAAQVRVAVAEAEQARAAQAGEEARLRKELDAANGTRRRGD